MHRKLMSSVVLFTSDPQRVRLAALGLLLAMLFASLLSAGAVRADGVPGGVHP